MDGVLEDAIWLKRKVNIVMGSCFIIATGVYAYVMYRTISEFWAGGFLGYFFSKTYKEDEQYYHRTLMITGETFGGIYFIIAIGFAIVFRRTYKMIQTPEMLQVFPELNGHLG